MASGSTASRVVKGAALIGAGALGATILTGVAMADDNGAGMRGGAIAGVAAEAGPGMHRGPGGPGGPGGFGGPGGPGGEVLHGDATVETPEGAVENIRTVRGEVTAVSDSSITVRATDGFEQTFTVNADTKVGKSRNEAAITDVAVGDQAMVAGVVDGDTVTARMVRAMTAEEAAEMEAEREERRAEMEQRIAERQAEQNADSTTES